MKYAVARCFYFAAKFFQKGTNHAILVNHKGTLWYPALASNKSWVRMQAWHEKQALPGELSFLPGELSFLPSELSFSPR